MMHLAGVLFLGYRESRIILRMLKPEVARGLITDAEAQTVASWVSQLRWLLSSLGSGGRFRARRQFLVAASRLALCYWHAETATASGAMTISMGQIPIYRAELERLRGAV